MMMITTPGRLPAATHSLARLTAPERAVHDALSRVVPGRFRCQATELRGTPDFVLDEDRLCLFVHGCFWHAHGCHLSRVPTVNRQFWEAKFTRNRARDAAALAALHRGGWRTLVVWECAVRGLPPARLAETLAEALRSHERHGEIVAGHRAEEALA